jgi:class 3 adenylate cyclase
MALRNQRLFNEREELLQAFSRFVPTPFITLLGHTDVRELSVGDQAIRQLAVCFFDVEGFTRRAEAIGPDRIFALLNRIYATVGPIISQHNGVIDKYMGDGIMVLFPGGPEQAIDAAEAVQQAIAELNTDPELLHDPITMRATLEFGQVILGTVGHVKRFDTTVIADPVNVASRLQGWSRKLGVPVLATADCQPADDRTYRRFLGAYPIRGRRQPANLYEHFGAHPNRDEREAARDNFEEGVRLFAQKDLLGAVGAFRASLAQHPEDPVARWLLREVATELQKL